MTHTRATTKEHTHWSWWNLGGIPRNSIANFVNMGSETINCHLRISSRIFGLQLPCPWSVPNVLSTSKEEATTMTAMKSNSIHATLGSSTWGLSQTHYWKNALAGVLNGVTHLETCPCLISTYPPQQCLLYFHLRDMLNWGKKHSC